MKVNYSISEQYFTGDYADPSMCSYLSNPCAYCLKLFQLMKPENDFRVGGVTQTIQYRNKVTDEIVTETKSEGICMNCVRDIMRRQQG
jgi:hypothetical protein